MKTKKEIIRETKTKKGSGLFAIYSFSTDIEINGKNYLFEKPFNSNLGIEIFVSTLDESDVLRIEHIGDCSNKAEYIEKVYEFINNELQS